jgi:acyl carrier protein
MNRSALRERLADMVAAASDGDVSAAASLVPGASLTDLGLGSLGFLRLIDAIEVGYGIELALTGEPPPDTVDDLAGQLERCGLQFVD